MTKKRTTKKRIAKKQPINTKKQVVIVDDHILFAQSLKSLINTFDDYEVAFLCKNGEEFFKKMEETELKIEIVLLDVNMPIMNGLEVMKKLSKQKSEISVLVLSMEDAERTIIRMLKFGARGYLLKDIHPRDLLLAFETVLAKGYYHSERISQIMYYDVNPNAIRVEKKIEFKPKEITFLKLVCTELTYKEIAEKMNMSPKTIDNYRTNLFGLLETKNRIGLVIYAIRNGIFTV